MKHVIYIIFALILAVAGCRDSGEEGTPGTSVVKIDVNRPYFEQLKTNDLFLVIGKRDFLRWGTFLQEIDAAMESRELPPGIPESEREGVIRRLRMQTVVGVLKKYITKGVLAEVALKDGLQVSEQEFDAQRKKDEMRYRKRGKAGLRRLEIMKKKDSFYEHMLTNVIYSTAYFNQVIVPKIEVSDEDAQTLVDYRKMENSVIPVTNGLYRMQMEDIRHDLLKGGDFTALAMEYSEGETAMSGGLRSGVFWDMLDPKLAEGLKSLKPGEISRVIETEKAYFLTKLIKREDANGIVDFAEIMIEKLDLKPLYSLEEARVEIRKRRAEMEAKMIIARQFKAAQIECSIPLFSDNEVKPSKRVLKRVSRPLVDLESFKREKLK